MISSYSKIENSYIENFSEREDKGDHILFHDEKLPDMHAFNCIFVKESMDKNRIESFVLHALDAARQDNRDFLKMMFHPKLELGEKLIEGFKAAGFEADFNLYMRLADINKLYSAKVNGACSVKAAEAEEEFEAARGLDMEITTRREVPADFAKRKTLRKKEVFRDPAKKLFLYLCRYQGQLAGSCELFIKDGYAKLEDFGVLEEFQRRGLGTAIFKKAVEDASGQGIGNIYLITGKDDTPRQMYGKLGFEIIGEELEIFWEK